MIRYDPTWSLPWWTGPSIQYVEDFLKENPKARVFEYGCGRSSLWLAERCGYYRGAEDNKEWVERVRGMISDLPHAAVSFMQGHGYIDRIKAEKDPFDLVVIDGIHRRDTITAAIPKLKSGGLMVVDDAQAEVYWGMQRSLVSWKRHAFLTSGKDSQHKGKVTCVYIKP